MVTHPDIPGSKLEQLAIAARGRPVAMLIRSSTECEARTLDGDVGRGPSLLSAIDHLIRELTGPRSETSSEADARAFNSMMRTNRGTL